MRLSRLAPVVFALAIAWPRPAHSAVTVDGRLDPAYGPPLVVQTTQTAGDDCLSIDSLDECLGSELDAAYGFIAADTLHLFLAGNLYVALNRVEPGSFVDALALFIDGGATGGADSVRADVPDGGLAELAGLKLDAGFHADHAFLLSANVLDFPHHFYVTEDSLSGSGPGTTTFLGGSTLGQGPGTLTTGTNPFGVLAAMNDSNTVGVTAGCAAGSGDGVTTGAELAIPLAAIGSPTGCVRVSALVFAVASPRFGFTPIIENQVLGPVPPGTCNLGLGSGVDFSAIPGDQFFTVCPQDVGVPAPAAPARLALSAAWPNPSRGALHCALALPSDAQVRCAIVDVAGRRVASVFSGALAAGTHTLDWSGRGDDGAPVRGGVYFVSATVDGRRLVRPVVVLGD